ncbi:YfhO family protein [Companilactobacillus jidongensis]|uniref:YfhO family protein n=1 Tax=Companilactobacillus jidongensis TaxID=2486006 RepID=UPI0013DE54ED|nr:YfhO family protein [Companilactobacillus jidongensis]
MKKLTSSRGTTIFLFGLLYAGLTLFMLLTIKRDFVWNGDDIYYQFQRMQNIVYSIRDAHTIPTISINNFGLIGYGINIFYPWITLIPFAIISFFITNPITIYYVGLAFFFLLSFCISHYAMKSFSGSTKQAVIFAVVYNFSTYRLIEMIARSSIAEYIATIFLPLCLLGFYEVMFRDSSKWKTLVVGISMVIFSHILTTFMLVILFVLLVIFNFRHIDQVRQRVISLVKAVITTVLATSIFTVPFIIEETFQKFGVPSPILLKGENLTKLVLYSLKNTSKRAIEGNVYNLGTILLLSLVIGLLFYKQFDKKYRIVYWISVISFLMTSNLFPWQLLEHTPIHVIQYPFRILMFTTLFASIVVAKIIELLSQGLNKKLWLTVAGMFIIINCSLWSISFNKSISGTLLSRDDLVITNKMIDAGLIPDTYLEQYVPSNVQATLGDITQHSLIINNNKSVLKPIITADGNSYELNHVKRGSIIDLPVAYYHGTSAKVNGKRIPINRSDRGSLRWKADHNYKHVTVITNYESKLLYWIVTMITILTWIFIMLPMENISFRKKLNNSWIFLE